MTVRINLLSGPRNLSTALMYSFAQRADTAVVDEPLYAHYLKISGANHPGRDEILASQENDGNKVIRDIMLGPASAPVMFFKNMAHHVQKVDLHLLKGMRHLFLIRKPSQIISSYSKVRQQVTLADIGLGHQWSLYQWLVRNGNSPLVMDSGDLLKNPRAMLPCLCKALGIMPDSAMLSWPAGARPEDGVWSKHWYGSVHQSTQFNRPDNTDRQFPEEYRLILEQAMPIYRRLQNVKLG